MKTPINPWAYAPSTQRREPTSTEIANGFPCGPADLQLFNELMYRSSLSAREIATVITGEGITLDETKVNQLQQAIFKIILRYNGSITLYLNQTGNDANDGLTAVTPLKTFNEAINRSAGYKSAGIIFGSDITITTAPLAIEGTKLVLFSPSITRSLTIAPGAWVTDSDGAKRVLRFNGSYDLNFDRVNLINNETEATLNAVCIGSGGFLGFANATYYVASSSVRPMFQSGNLTGVAFSNYLFGNTDAAAKFLRDVPSAGDPNAYWPWKSNRTSM